jgi:hypothetical protein
VRHYVEDRCTESAQGDAEPPFLWVGEGYRIENKKPNNMN